MRPARPPTRARAGLARRLETLGLPRVPITRERFPLMLPTLVEEVPDGPGWLFELKWDGVRVLVLRADGRVALWSRTGRDASAQYPEVVQAVAGLAGGDLALDGEVVALDDAGRPSFELLQRRMHVVRGRAAAVAAVPVVAYVYDCLAADGRDLRGLPLAERKWVLRALVPGRGPLRYCEHVEGQGRRFLAAACAAGLEGVVAKRADSPYRGGRRGEWRKIKCQLRQEFVIGGYTAPRGTRAHLGSVHVGWYDGDTLVYAGRVGSGLDGAALGDLAARLRRLAADRSPFGRGTPPRDRQNHWVRPELVCEVRFTAWTEDGQLRHPVFLGLRPDKEARTVSRETPTPRS
jgi:bifunctional non-homologous end joining protein LigD